MNLKNNLFYYATSELSQDAFICWLTSFALKDNDPTNPLCECAKEMIEMFVDELKGQAFTLENVEHQTQNIDVLLTVKANHQIHKIIIEDKIFSNEHDNQLIRYLDEVIKKSKSENVECIAHGVYYKTGFQSYLSNVYEANYKYISLKDMIRFLQKYKNRIDNQIFKDYYNYWNNYLEDALKYKESDPSSWDEAKCYCFFNTLQEEKVFEWIGYGYVSNQRGGFQGLWFGKNDNKFTFCDTTFSLYLQVESFMEKDSSMEIDSRKYLVRLKVRFDSNSFDKNNILTLLYSESEINLNKYSFKKLKRMREGETMTIAEYSEQPKKTVENFKQVLFKAYNNYSDILDQIKKRIKN